MTTLFYDDHGNKFFLLTFRDDDTVEAIDIPGVSEMHLDGTELVEADDEEIRDE